METLIRTRIVNFGVKFVLVTYEARKKRILKVIISAKKDSKLIKEECLRGGTRSWICFEILFERTCLTIL